MAAFLNRRRRLGQGATGAKASGTSSFPLRAARGVARPAGSGTGVVRGLIGVGLIVVLAGTWYLTTGPLGWVPELKFPSPAGALASLMRLMHPGYAGATLAGHIESSLGLVLMGFGAATLTGVALGLLMGWSRLADAYLNPIFQIIRPIAPIAWIPLTILWFGLGAAAKVFVIWLAAFSPALINTHTGIRNLNRTVIEAARVHGASTWDLLWGVAIPGALPNIFTGLRISLQACWMVLVAAELVGSYTGLGHIMIIATQDLNSGMIFIAMVCVALLGVVMTLALAQVEKWVIPWRR